MVHQPAPLPLTELTVVEDTTPRRAGFNMALDEVLLATVNEAAILRCYRWLEPSISFGCFGSLAAVRRDYPGLPLVRRWTGGGIVEHGADFTFTLLVPKGLPLAAMSAQDSYRLIHAAVASALGRAGVPGLGAAPAAPLAVHPAGAPFLKPCFSHPVPHDLMVAGRKVAGGAQRRTKHGLLHQGSIQGLFGVEGPDESARQSLAAALAAALSLSASLLEVTLQQEIQTAELAARKYDSRAWTERF